MDNVSFIITLEMTIVLILTTRFKDIGYNVNNFINNF